MTIGTRLFTWMKGEKVGEDRFGNRYFRERGGRRRLVLYTGGDEPSKVPAEWHGWLHYTQDKPPTETPPPVQPWQQEHQPNHTGTAQANRPPGSLLGGGRRPPATGDYEPWQPDDGAA